jgi:hypothetical protein
VDPDQREYEIEQNEDKNVLFASLFVLHQNVPMQYTNLSDIAHEDLATRPCIIVHSFNLSVNI